MLPEKRKYVVAALIGKKLFYFPVHLFYLLHYV